MSEPPGKRLEIRIAHHALERAGERGATEEEIRDVVNSGLSIPARYGRLARAKVYEFKQERHGKYYEQKRLEVVYAVEEETAVLVTVYVFYGKWEKSDADSL